MAISDVGIQSFSFLWSRIKSIIEIDYLFSLTEKYVDAVSNDCRIARNIAEWKLMQYLSDNNSRIAKYMVELFLEYNEPMYLFQLLDFLVSLDQFYAHEGAAFEWWKLRIIYIVSRRLKKINKLILPKLLF